VRIFSTFIFALPGEFLFMDNKLPKQLQQNFFDGHMRFAKAWKHDGNIGYSPIDEPPTIEDIEAHINGRQVLGCYTLREDTSVIWVMWDVDTKPFDEKKARNITRAIIDALGNIPCMVEFSGSKGYHVWVFLNEPTLAALVKPLVERVREVIGARSSGPVHVECYPKQANFDGIEGYGNLGKLPLGLHPLTNERSRFVNPYTWEPLTEQEVYEALQRKVEFADFAAQIDSLQDIEPIQKIINAIAPHWVDGQRHYVALYVAGLLCNAGWSKEDADQVIQGLCDLFGDDPKNVLQAVEDTYKRKENGSKVIGYKGSSYISL